MDQGQGQANLGVPYLCGGEIGFQSRFCDTSPTEGAMQTRRGARMPMLGGGSRASRAAPPPPRESLRRAVHMQIVGTRTG